MRVYLAGPDVFLPDALGRAQCLKEICARHGLVGVSPLDPHDGEPAIWDSLPDPFRIERRNEAHIQSCAALIANLTPFRGPSADVGTVFELGYMRALGRPVFGWSNCGATLLDRTRASLATRTDQEGVVRDGEGLAVESFGLRDNLMIDGAIAAAGGVFLAREVRPAERWDDLEAFRACVAAASDCLLRARAREVR